MNPLRELAYRAKLLLLHIYGPPQLDEDHDPVVQLKREHARELREEEPSAADERGEPGSG